MPGQFLLPDLGEGLTEAAIVSWLVTPGEIVAIDQPVVEVESAKSIVELPSPFAGRVGTLHAAVGDVVSMGSPLVTVLEDAQVTVLDDAKVPVAVPESAPTAVGSGAVLVGYGTRESTVKLKRPEGGRFGRSDTAQLRRSPVISPIVRKLARDHGLDASELVGSGRNALVVRRDVEAAISRREPTAGAASPSPAPSPEASGATASTPSTMDVPNGLGLGELRVPMTAMRKLISSRLSHSRTTIPEATVWLDVDATELLRTKERLQKTTGERFSLTALIARFVVSGLKQYPVLNSSVDEATDEIVQHGAINLGLAAQTPRGLMVPVVHNAHDLTTRQLKDQIAAVVTSAERGDFSPATLTGGTFTLNNYGGFGVDGSTPIINSPEVAMLGVGRVIDRPWVVDGELAVRKVVVLSFVFDHRVCDGDVASGFLTYVARCVEEPLLLLSNV